MHRRDLLKMIVLGGTAVTGTRRALAAAPYRGPYLLTIHAAGGWDSTLFFNGLKPSADLQQNLYTQPVAAGGFNYAPISYNDGSTVLDSPARFLTDHGAQLLAINGIDTQTNNHDVGTRHVWSGKSFEDLPSLSALLAAKVARTYQVPLAYLSTGGYESTGGLVPLTRFNDTALVRLIAQPRMVNPNEAPVDHRDFQPPEVQALMAAASSGLLSRLRNQATLPRHARSLDRLRTSRLEAAGLETFAGALPTAAVDTRTAFPQLNYDNGSLTYALRGAEIALAGFASGQAVSANLAVGSFDTHGNHDAQHVRELGHLCLVLRFIFGRLSALKLTNQVLVVIGSDFGRTPTYNEGRGKDHWNVTSMLVSGLGIAGGRTLGATDSKLKPMSISASNPAQVLEAANPAGTRLLPAHLQRALRKRLGLLDDAIAAPFSLPVDKAVDDLLT
jgi:Protein of unknown function (DUF1501)